MNKFTKGPWVVDFDGQYYNVISEDCGEIIGCEGFYSEHERDKANSALCAAAPDLYEALEDMTMLWRVTAELKGWEPDHVVEYRNAKKILAKARGEYEA